MSQSKLMLARDAAYFGLSTVDGRRWSCRALTDLFIDFQRFLLPKVIVEVGAFDAWFSREMRAHLPGSRSVAFEANPHNFEHFSQKYDFAKLGVDYRHMAISDRSGQTEFQLIKKRNGQDAPTVKGDDSLLKRRHAGVYGDVEYEIVSVETGSLDGLFTDSEYAADDFSLWIDVEGAAGMVLGGARRTLERTRSIFIEVEEKSYWSNQWLFDDILTYLEPIGFHCVARDFENAHQFNVIFVNDIVVRHFMFSDRMVNYYHRLGRAAKDGVEQ